MNTIDEILELVQTRSFDERTNSEIKKTDPTFIESIPIVRKAVEIRCSICLDDKKPDTQLHELPCKHNFCLPQDGGCCGIVPWLREHNTCPMCKYELPFIVENPDVNGDTLSDISDTVVSDILLGRPPHHTRRRRGAIVGFIDDVMSDNMSIHYQRPIHQHPRSGHTSDNVNVIRQLFNGFDRTLPPPPATTRPATTRPPTTTTIPTYGCGLAGCEYCLHGNVHSTIVGNRAKYLAFYHNTCSVACQLILNDPTISRNDALTIISLL